MMKATASINTGSPEVPWVGVLWEHPSVFQLLAAMSVYSMQARGPASEKYAERLAADCTDYWQSGRNDGDLLFYIFLDFLLRLILFIVPGSIYIKKS